MKNALRLLEAIGQIQDGYIVDAHSDPPKASVSRKRIFLIAAAAAALLLAGCAAYAWHWYAAYFSMQRQEPLSDSQVSYIQENARDMHASQTHDGYTMELKSALAESREAYITLGITAPADVKLVNREDERLFFQNAYAKSGDDGDPLGMSCQILEDGDGRENTANVVVRIGIGDTIGGEAAFDAHKPWKIVLGQLTADCWDREYEEELLKTKYAGVTDFMFTDEEAARAHTWLLLTSEKWEFEVTFDTADEQTLELLTEPMTTKAVITRKDRTDPMTYGIAEFVEDITITSVQLHLFGATVTFETPECKEGSEYPDFFCVWMDMGDTYNPLTKLVSEDENFFVVLKDGTRIDFWQGMGGIETAELRADSPIVMKDVDYLQLSDGTKLYAP